MASNNQSSINLGLPQLPDQEGLEPKMWQQLVLLYNAVKILSGAIDRYTGFNPTYADDYQFLAGEDVRNTFLFGSNAKIYVQYQFTASYGDIINLQAGGAYSANGGNIGAAQTQGGNIFFSNAAFRPAHGFCSVPDGVTSGDYGEVSLSGIIPVTGLTRGKVYQLNNNGAADWYEFIRTSSGVTAGVQLHLQNIGIAIANNALFFNPSKDITYAIKGTGGAAAWSYLSNLPYQF